jgi:hypothetical protein
MSHIYDECHPVYIIFILFTQQVACNVSTVAIKAFGNVPTFLQATLFSFHQESFILFR